MALDVKIFFLLNDLTKQSKIFDNLIVFFASYFQYFLVAVFLLLLFFSAHERRKKFRIFLVTTLSAIIARFGITELIRFFYHRPRPFTTYQVRQLLPESGWSFPSGHAAFFFAVATAIYFYNKKWGTGFFIASILMNISRIIGGVHYPSDIVGGMIVGIATACLVFYLAKRGIDKPFSFPKTKEL